MSISQLSIAVADAVNKWRDFANTLKVTAPNGSFVTWTEYLHKYTSGKADERTVVGPTAFPMFVHQMLGFDVGQTVYAEVSGPEVGRILHPPTR